MSRVNSKKVMATVEANIFSPLCIVGTYLMDNMLSLRRKIPTRFGVLDG